MSNFVGGLQNVLESANTTRADIHVNDMEVDGDLQLDGRLQPEVEIDYNSGNPQLCLARSDSLCNSDMGVDASNNFNIRNGNGGGASLNLVAQNGNVYVRPFDTTDVTTNFKVQRGDGGSGYTDIFQVDENNITSNLNTMNVPPTWTLSNGNESINLNDLSNEIFFNTGGSLQFQIDNDSVISQNQFLTATTGVGAPGYAFDGVADMGMYQETSTRLGFATQGTQALRLSQTEAVFFEGARMFARTAAQAVALAATLTGTNNGLVIFVSDQGTSPTGRLCYYVSPNFYTVDSNTQVV